MSEPDAYQQLWARFHQPTDVDGVLQDLSRLDDLATSGKLILSDAYRLRVKAFFALLELTESDPVTGGRLILDRLLPYCLEEPAGTGTRSFAYQFRQCLASWLNHYREVDRVPLRDQVLDRLIGRLRAARPAELKDTCWTISTLGFRRADAVEALWEIEERYTSEIGDAALSTLVYLGLPPEERERVLAAAHRRAEARFALPLLNALRRLADPESIEIVRDHWLCPLDAESWKSQGWLAVHVLTDIADADYANVELQERIWQTIVELRGEHEDVALLAARDTAPLCNSPYVIRSLMGFLAQWWDEDKTATWGRYLLYDRLAKCIRPKQLQGWEGLEQREALDVLHSDACRNTETRGMGNTESTRVKEEAWGVLLRMGYADALSWLEEAVGSETNPFVCQHITEQLACFRFDPLPATVLRLVTEPYDEDPARTAPGEMILRLAATRVARSAATREAFEALRSFGLSYQGKALQESVDALAEVAIHLVREGDTSVIDALLETATSALEERHRTAAAGALYYSAVAELLPSQCATRLAGLALDEGRSRFERSQYVAALGLLPAGALPPAVIQHLLSWVTHGDDWLSWRSLEALARHNQLLVQPSLLANCLRLRQVEDQWDLIPGTEFNDWAPFIIGLLYLDCPAAFTPAISSLLRKQGWRAAIQVLDLLVGTAATAGQSPPPAGVLDALLARIREQQSHSYAETEIFEVVARLAPDTLAEESWESIWQDWLPDARAALADALGEAAYSTPNARKSAVSHLLPLTQDSQYAVRRAAYRALARQAPDSLQAVYAAWAQASTVDLRQRAAEAFVWISSADEEDDSQGVCQQLVSDQERPVRQAAERAWRERRDRLWAETYLSSVCTVEGESNAGVLRTWRYGRAISEVGDDVCLRRIENHLATQTLPPHIRHWLRQVAKGIEEHWRKVTGDWPEPWLPWPGTIEEGQGAILLPGGQRVEVHYSLWNQPPSTPSGHLSWGGAVWPVGLEHIVASPRRFAIILGDGRQGTGTVASVSGSVLAFLGEGPYPYSQDAGGKRHREET
jgi:hypothetical protein